MEQHDFEPSGFPEHLSHEQLVEVHNALEITNVSNYRYLVFNGIREGHKAIFDSLVDEEGAFQRANDQVADFDERIVAAAVEDFAGAYGIDSAHPAYARVAELLTRYSPVKMDVVLWEYGPTDERGEHITEQSGKAKFEQEVASMFGEKPETTDEASRLTSVTETSTLQADLEAKRAVVADLSVQRRARLTKRTGKKSRELSERYTTAFREYGEAYQLLGEARIRELRESGAGDEAIAQAVIIGTVEERRLFTIAEVESLEEDSSIRNRLARLYSKRLGMVTANTAIGLPIGVAAREVAKFGAVAAVPVAGLAVVAAIRAGRSVFTSVVGSRARLHSDLEKRQAQDIQAISDAFEESVNQVPVGENVEASTYAKGSMELIVKSVNERVHKDIRGNRNIAIASAVIAGGAVVVGSVIADKFADKAVSMKTVSMKDTIVNSYVKDNELWVKPEGGSVSIADRREFIESSIKIREDHGEVVGLHKQGSGVPDITPRVARDTSAALFAGYAEEQAAASGISTSQWLEQFEAHTDRYAQARETFVKQNFSLNGPTRADLRAFYDYQFRQYLEAQENNAEN